MNQIRETEAGPVPYSDQMLRKDNLQTSFPKVIADETKARYNVYPVTLAPKPEVTKTQVAEKMLPAKQPDGTWFQDWIIRDKTAEELDLERKGLFNRINEERERRINVGSAFPVTGITDPIPLTGRPFDRQVYDTLLLRAQSYKAAGVTDPIIRLRDANDVIHMLTATQYEELAIQAMQWFEDIMAISWAMKDGTAPFENGIPDNLTDDSNWTTS